MKNKAQVKKRDTLKLDEMTLDTLFKNIPVPMFILNADRRICKMTLIAEGILSKSTKEIENLPFGNALNCTYSLDDPRGCGFGLYCKKCPVRSTLSGVFQNGSSCYRKEIKLTIGKEKRSCFLIISATPIDLPSGENVLLYFEDITERRQTEEALKIARDNLNRAQAVARIGSWHLDIINNILIWSDETYRIFGLDMEAPLTYERFLEIVHPDDREYVDKRWKAALNNKEPYDIEHRIAVDGKVKWVREKARVEFNEAGKAVSGIGTVQDISEHKQQEEDSRRLREELMHVSRVAALGELTAALAHELNQPLTAIMSNAQAAQRFLAETPPDLNETREILSDIIKDNKRASGVIARLRALLKKSELEFTTLNINDVIREVISLLRSDTVIKNISLSTELSGNIPFVCGDRIQLQQVILNLIINSFEAMAGVYSKALYIHTAEESEEVITVSIKDTGTGIDEKNIDRLFKPFFTTKKEGMGMGLAINKAIIEAHRGSLWAKNNPDKGSTFYFTLPVCQEHSK